MHVNSEMPFSVYFKTSDGVSVRAPYDVDILRTGPGKYQQVYTPWNSHSWDHRNHPWITGYSLCRICIVVLVIWLWHSAHHLWSYNALKIGIVKELLKDLNKAFENRIRLGIMSALVINDHLDFNSLKGLLDVTDGNLATHLRSLEKSNYISFQKEFLGRKPNTRYSATDEGRAAFIKHIKAIEKLLK